MTASPCDTCGKGMENMRLLKKLTEAEIENDKLRFQTEILDIAFDVKRNDLRKLSDENAKLRYLAKLFAEYVSQDRCEGCVFKSRCNDGLIDECFTMAEIRKKACELGIEV